MRLRFLLLGGLLLAAAGCGSDTSSPSTPGATTGTPVSIVNGASVLTTTAFSPSTTTVTVGGSVTWTNNDNTTHTSTASNGAWDSGGIAPGGRFTRTFTTAGSFPYHCTIHPGMVGTITVQ
jgi:plastocyanin